MLRLSEITQKLYCPLHTLLRHVDDDESNSEKVIKNHRVVNKRQQDNINGVWLLLLLAQLIHQKCGEENGELIETNGKSKTNAMRKRKIGWKWIQQSFFFLFMLCAEGLWCGCSECETIKLYLGGFSENNSMSFYAFLRPLTVYDLDNIRRWLCAQHYNIRTTSSQEKCGKVEFFSLPCRHRIITVVRRRRNCAVWLVRVSVLFANGWCGSVGVLATTRKQ